MKSSGLIKFTDYPKYSSVRLLPFWYSNKSTIDRRKLAWSFLLLYNETDGPWERRIIFPLYQSTTDSVKNSADRLWGFPVIPLVYYHGKPGYTHVNILWRLKNNP